MKIKQRESNECSRGLVSFDATDSLQPRAGITCKGFPWSTLCMLLEMGQSLVMCHLSSTFLSTWSVRFLCQLHNLYPCLITFTNISLNVEWHHICTIPAKQINRNFLISRDFFSVDDDESAFASNILRCRLMMDSNWSSLFVGGW